MASVGKPNPTTFATVLVADLKPAIKYAANLLKKRRPAKLPAFSLQVSGGHLHLDLKLPDSEHNNAIKAGVSGVACSHRIWVNPEYILQFLKTVKSKTVVIGLGEPNELISLSSDAATQIAEQLVGV
jgi:hypothetical protein